MRKYVYMPFNVLQLRSLACKLTLALHFSSVNIFWWIVQKAKVKDKMCVHVFK